MAGKYQKLLSIKEESFDFIDKSARAMALNILRGVVIETPRDQGFASANWNVTTSNPSDAFSQAKTDRNEAIRNGSITIQGFSVERDKQLYIQNHTDYIERLNLGWSKQAGSFYVDKIISRVVNG